jgi:hypothetical protein
MNSSDNTDIRQQERELFASMAKVRQPMAPDSEPMQPETVSSPGGENLPWDHADAMRMRVKARFPTLTDEELDEFGL